MLIYIEPLYRSVTVALCCISSVTLVVSASVPSSVSTVPLSVTLKVSSVTLYYAVMTKGSSTFTRAQADRIRELLRQKVESGNLQPFRNKLRGLGFYITDFTSYTYGGFSVDDFDRLVRTRRITITD